MTYIQECLEKFQELPSAFKEKIGGAATFNLIKELEKKYNVSLSFLVVLLAIGELDSEDIVDYVTAKYKLVPEAAKNLGEEIEIKILDPIFEELIGAEEAAKPAFLSSAQEKELVLRIFSEKLVETLKNDKFADLQKLNILIFKAFQLDDSFEDKIINTFYNNQEVLTGGRIILESSEVRPTISNWLKDFIFENGSELFSNIVLVKYLASNQNVRKLKEAERELIRKLLKLYRNLVFFPESMENVPLEEWEIFPIGKAEKKLGGEVPNVRTPKITTTPPITESADNELTVMEKMLDKYQPASLEHKAISQEISRFKVLEFKKAQQKTAVKN